LLCEQGNSYGNTWYPDDILNKDISNKNISKIEIPNEDKSKILIY
jgi:hypothetical protein